jgi:hypothetical protein
LKVIQANGVHQVLQTSSSINPNGSPRDLSTSQRQSVSALASSSSSIDFPQTQFVRYRDEGRHAAFSPRGADSLSENSDSPETFFHNSTSQSQDSVQQRRTDLLTTSLGQMVLTPNRDEIVKSLMKEVRTVLDWNFKTLARARGNDSSGSNGGPPSSFERGSSDQAPSRKRRRTSDGDDGSPDGRENGKDSGSQGDKGDDATSSKDPGRKLACPFYKHMPREHMKDRSCAGPGWMKVHRVK